MKNSIKSKIGFFLMLITISTSINADNKNKSWFGNWGKTIAAWGTVFAGVGLGSWYLFIKRPQMQENKLIAARRAHLTKARRKNSQLFKAMDDKISNIDKGLAEDANMTRAQYVQWLKKREEAGKL